MKMTDRELLKDALRAIELWSLLNAEDLIITQKIRARLAEPEDEPVYLFRRRGFDDYVTCSAERYLELSQQPKFFEMMVLYRHPPRPPVRLSDDEI